jgi:predicted neuraminidase
LHRAALVRLALGAVVAAVVGLFLPGKDTVVLLDRAKFLTSANDHLLLTRNSNDGKGGTKQKNGSELHGKGGERSADGKRGKMGREGRRKR